MSGIEDLHGLLPRRYQLLEAIGQGGMGAVYLAADRLRGQQVALKHISNKQILELLDDSQAYRLRTALTHEFRTLATLRHPHVVSVLDYGFDTQGTPFFSMEWLRGGVDMLSAGSKRDENGRVDLFIQLLRALHYVHRRGIIHRDLKPNNILVCEGQLKVLDFGLSMKPGFDKEAAGTLLYIAPEAINGEMLTPAIDLYAVGVLMYEMFTGAHPFPNRDNLADFLLSVANDPPDLAPLPAHLAPIVERLLAKKPGDRFLDAREVILALDEATSVVFPVETLATRDSFIHSTHFVGRSAELAQLRAALQAGGQVWLVGGESGVGKSRLLDELRIEALTTGAGVVTGQALEGGGSTYQMWLGIIRALLLGVELPDEDLAILGVLNLDLPGLLGRALPAVPPLAAEDLQMRLVEVITRLVVEARGLIVLEDVQWASEESLDLVQHIAARLAGHAVLLVAAYRLDEAPHLPDKLPDAQVMRLEPFDQNTVAEMLRKLLGDERDALVAALHRETEGNAFFLAEVLRVLAEQVGELDAVRQADVVELPQRIRDMLRRRFESLGKATQALLQLAALAGREIDEQLLELLAPTLDIETALREGAEFHVTEWQDGVWRFAHDKLRAEVIAGLPEGERVRLHGEIAVVLEKLYEASSTNTHYLPALALHWEAYGDLFKALSYLVLLAQDAFRLAAYEDALAYVARAIRAQHATAMLPHHIARQIMDAYYMQFYAYRQREQRELLHGVYMEALSLAGRSALPDLFLRAYQLGADTGALTHNPALARECALKMMAYAEAGTGEYLLAQYRLSQGLRMEQHFTEAIEIARQALASIDRAQPWQGWRFKTTLHSHFAFASFFDSANAAIWSFSTSLGYSYMMLGDDSHALEYLQRALEAMQSQPTAARYMISLHNYALYAQGHGDLASAWMATQQLAEQAQQFFPALSHTAAYLTQIVQARSVGDLTAAAAGLLELAQVNYAEQEIEDAVICARDALLLYEQLADSSGQKRAQALLRQLGDPLM